MPMDRAPTMQNRSIRANAAQRRMSMRRGWAGLGSVAIRVIAVSATGMTTELISEVVEIENAPIKK